MRIVFHKISGAAHALELVRDSGEHDRNMELAS